MLPSAGLPCGTSTVDDARAEQKGQPGSGLGGAPGCAAPPYDAGPAPPGYRGLGPPPTPGPWGRPPPMGPPRSPPRAAPRDPLRAPPGVPGRPPLPAPPNEPLPAPEGGPGSPPLPAPPSEPPYAAGRPPGGRPAGSPPDGGHASGPGCACGPSAPPAGAQARTHQCFGSRVCLLLQAASSRSTRRGALALLEPSSLTRPRKGQWVRCCCSSSAGSSPYCGRAPCAPGPPGCCAWKPGPALPGAPPAASGLEIEPEHLWLLVEITLSARWIWDIQQHTCIVLRCTCACGSTLGDTEAGRDHTKQSLICAVGHQSGICAAGGQRRMICERCATLP